MFVRARLCVCARWGVVGGEGLQVDQKAQELVAEEERRVDVLKIAREQELAGRLADNEAKKSQAQALQKAQVRVSAQG